ncbi:MAG: hypothetical protein ACK4FV_05295 [Candidatus Nitrosocaldus sp.]
MSSDEEARSESEMGSESEVKGREDVMMEQRGGEEEKKVLVMKSKGRRGRRPKVKEEMPTPPTEVERVHIPSIEQVMGMLKRYEKILGRIEDRLEPVRRIEKESSAIKVLRKEVKDLTKQVSRLEKSVNKLIAGKSKGKGKRGRKTTKR